MITVSIAWTMPPNQPDLSMGTAFSSSATSWVISAAPGRRVWHGAAAARCPTGARARARRRDERAGRARQAARGDEGAHICSGALRVAQPALLLSRSLPSSSSAQGVAGSLSALLLETCRTFLNGSRTHCSGFTTSLASSRALSAANELSSARLNALSLVFTGR